MRVERAITSDGRERYMLVNEYGEVIDPVLRFLKYRDNTGSARNTLRTYCYELKLYFEFLTQIGKEFMEVNIDDMASFIGWLQMPEPNAKVRYMQPQESNRTAKTINSIMNTVLVFYDYLLRHEDYQLSISDNLKRQMSYSRRGYKDFLYHINKNKKFLANIIKLKEPKKKPKTLSKNQIELLIENCTNKRDRFLLRLLWESSMRIGEALSLWLEDFNIGETRIEIKDRGELENFAEIKTINSPRIIDVSSDLINEFMEYVSDIHDDEVDTNYVFIKLEGSNKKKPMEYQDVVSLFNRLKKKTGIDVNPHMLRHSSLTELRRSGWEGEHLRLRAGHKNIQTTMQLYIHPSDEDLRNDWINVQKNMQLKKRSENDELSNKR